VVADNQANLRSGTKYGKVFVIALTGWLERSEKLVVVANRRQRESIGVVHSSSALGGLFDFATASENTQQGHPTIWNKHDNILLLMLPNQWDKSIGNSG
jgi:hypothetical protein